MQFEDIGIKIGLYHEKHEGIRKYKFVVTK